MGILFRADRRFSEFAVMNLFSSAGWMSAEYPHELWKSLRGAQHCVTAWDGGLLVGLCAILSDGQMTAYVNYLLVLPEYQRRGIGSKLFELALGRLGGHRRVILLAEPDKHAFYEKFGFRVDEHAQGMALIVR